MSIPRELSRSHGAVLRLLCIHLFFTAACTASHASVSWASDLAPAPSTTASIEGVHHPTPVEPPQQFPDRLSGEYLKSYLTDTGKILTSPGGWDGDSWLKLGIIASITTGIYLGDSDIRQIAHRNQSPTGATAAQVGNALGNPFYTGPTLGLFYLYGHLADDSRARRTSLLAVESLAISGTFTWTLKEIIQRPRPGDGVSSTTWNGPRGDLADYSFPSGHTTAAFSVASVIAEEYGNNPAVPPLAYGLATLTGLARIYDDKHWASDAFLGGAIGYFVGKAVVRSHGSPDYFPVRITPIAVRNGGGLTVEYRY